MSATSQEPLGERQNRGIAFLVVALIFTTIASIVVTLRVYIRVWVKRAFGWDDALIIFSLLLAIVSTAFNIPEVIAGYGQHIHHLSLHQLSEALKWNYLATPLLVFSLAASKISICLLLLRVLKQTQAHWSRYFPYAVIAILTIISVPSAGYSLGQCQPVSKLWNPTAPGNCKNPQIFVRLGYANGAINAFCDFALALFPITFVKDLHLPFHKKLVLGLLMSCGIVCGSLAIARTILTGDLNAQSDITYVSVSSSLLAVVEENVSIIVACVPTLGPLFAFFSDKIKTFNSRRHHTQLEETARPPRKEIPISLGSMTDPARPALRYESSAEPLGKPYQGIYGSQTSLVRGIQKTTRVDVLRGDALV